MTEPNPNKLDGPTEILIVSCAKDFQWLRLALECIQKHCVGFSGVTVVIPNRDLHALHRDVIGWIPSGRIAVNVRYFDEVEGKGMLHHMIILAEAEKYVPAGTKYVLTCDSDCMYRMATTPEHYAWNDKPYYIVRTWDSLTTEDPRNPGSKIVSDNLQWKPPTDRQLGMDTQIFGMCMNTVLFPIDSFPAYRDHVTKAQRQPFTDFMLSGQNGFPQDRMDYTAMGAFAFHFMPERFHWFDVEAPPYPVDRKRAYWSHGGITPEIRAEIESFLK